MYLGSESGFFRQVHSGPSVKSVDPCFQIIGITFEGFETVEICCPAHCIGAAVLAIEIGAAAFASAARGVRGEMFKPVGQPVAAIGGYTGFVEGIDLVDGL